MTELILKNKKPNEKKLLAFGFTKKETECIYQKDIVDKQLCLTITISNNGTIYTNVVDKNTNEEYILHRVASAEGSFVGRVKTEYSIFLDEIFSKCFDDDIFKSEQTKKIVTYIFKKYNDELEFLWRKFPNNAIVRRKDNRKWYAAILTIPRSKIGLDSDEFVEIIDLRMNSQEIDKKVDNKSYFFGYHMNKKHWITICLDGTVSDEDLYLLIDESYRLSKK